MNSGLFHVINSCRINSVRVLSDTRSFLPHGKKREDYVANFQVALAPWWKLYEEFIGISEVKEAQARVIEAEKRFISSQDRRRELHFKIADLSKELKSIHLELDKTVRGEDKYLKLITQEHAILKNEKYLSEEFNVVEKSERENFSVLSSTLRDSHEKERAQSEKTKYWSIIGSMTGAVIGILGSSINNWLRLRQLRNIVTESTGSPEKINALLVNLDERTTKQQMTINESLDHLLEIHKSNANEQDHNKQKSEITEQIFKVVSELKQLYSAENSDSSSSDISSDDGSEYSKHTDVASTALIVSIPVFITILYGALFSK